MPWRVGEGADRAGEIDLERFRFNLVHIPLRRSSWRIRLRDGVDQPADSRPQSLDGASGSLAQERLELEKAISIGLKSGE